MTPKPLRILLISLLFSLCLGVIVPSPHYIYAQTAPTYLIYANQSGGLSLVSIQDGLLSSPQPFMSASNPAPNSYFLQLSPDNKYLAAIQASENWATLSILSFPDGEIMLSQSLLPADFNPSLQAEAGDPLRELSQAIGTMAWSNHSGFLAFVSGHADQNANLYVAEIASGEILALENETGAAALLAWSPNDDWLVYSDLLTFSGEAGFLSKGIIAIGMSARTQGQRLPLDLSAAYPNDVIRVGWRDADTLLISPRSFIAGARGLYSWHIPNQSIQTHLPEALEMGIPAYAPLADILAFVVPDLGANNPLPAGFYVARIGTSTPISVLEGTFMNVRLVHRQYLQLSGQNGELLINPINLQEQVLPAGEIATFLSPDTAYILSYFSHHIRISTLDAEEFLEIDVTEALPPTWLNDARYLVVYGQYQNASGLLLIDTATGTVSRVDDQITLDSTWVLAG